MRSPSASLAAGESPAAAAAVGECVSLMEATLGPKLRFLAGEGMLSAFWMCLSASYVEVELFKRCCVNLIDVAACTIG